MVQIDADVTELLHNVGSGNHATPRTTEGSVNGKDENTSGDGALKGGDNDLVILLFRQRCAVGSPLEVRVAVIGNVDSGKSTMVGVLTRSMLDDGRGAARSKVFKHEHGALPATL